MAWQGAEGVEACGGHVAAEVQACLDECKAEYRGETTPDCWKQAWRVAEVLVRTGKAPFILRIRDWKTTPAGRWIGPLTPTRYPGGARPTWSTHYVCVCDGIAYEPLLERPVILERHGEMMFGREVVAEECVSADRVLEYVRAGHLPNPSGA